MRRNRALLFIRKNAVYVVLALCIIAVGLSVTLMMVAQNNSIRQELEVPVVNPDNNGDTTPDEPVDNVITFTLPVEKATGIEEYSEMPVFNSTLGRYEAHLAVDFFAPEGTDVVAVYDGKVESIENSLIYGTTITIDHGNGLKTVYNSLADGDMVVAGQQVAKGEVIGQVSVTNRHEYKEGAHLHFEVFENDVSVDPALYLMFEEK